MFVKSILLIVSMMLSTGNAEMQNLKLLKKGRGDAFSWSLYLGPNGENETNLVLIIKNDGAKLIDLEGINSGNFSLMSSSQKQVKVLRISGFDDIQYKSVLVTQVVLEGNVKFKEKMYFSMKKKKEAFVPIEIISSINSIE